MNKRIPFRAMTMLLTSALATVLPLHGSDIFGNGVIKVPSSALGGTGTAANLQVDDDTSYSVAKSGDMTVGGFGGYAGAINSVYLFVQYSVESGYTGTNGLKVNGVDTTIVPADRDYGRWRYVEITGGSFGIDTTSEIQNLSVSFTNNDGGGGDAVLFDCIYVVVNPTSPIPILPTWVEDFNGTGAADPMVWNYELGYQRNNELQYYVQGASNGWQENGNFVIEGRKETINGYAYTSASIVTSNKYYWHYGRAQIRAQIPAKAGMWPAIWGTGQTGEWPYNGEVDIMEYYQNKILANCAVGNGQRWTAKWDSSNRTIASLTLVDPAWKTQWHIWTMQWDETNVRLYVDNILMNTIPQTWLKNTDGYNTSWGPHYPFITNGMTCWLNLAMGGAGGDPTATMNSGAQRYLIDYWKIWEGATSNVAPTNIAMDLNSVAEGQPIGTVVGSLSATDADPAEVHRYTLVTGTGSTHNSQFSIPEFVSDNTTQGVLKTAAVLNFADGPTRSIRVRVTDIEGATYDKVMTVNVITSGNHVIYNGNGNTGGSVPVDGNGYPDGATVTVLGNTNGLTKSGFTFSGWNTMADASGTGYAPGATLTIGASDVTLHAVWLPDTTNPTVVSFSPPNGATNVPAASSLMITFDEEIALGTGLITIKNLTDATQSSIDVSDVTRVSVSGAVLTVNPSANLSNSKNFAIRIAGTAIRDLSGNAYAGIANDTTWAFATAAPPPSGVVFSDNFEPGATGANGVNGGGTTPDVATYTLANTSTQANTTLWVRADQGFNASRNGLIDDTGTDFGYFSDPVGSQAYGFRYTNSGLTSAAGKIGTLAPGQTITVSFDVARDGWDSDGNTAGIQYGVDFEAGLILFDAGASRNFLNGGFELNAAAVLAKKTGSLGAAGTPYATWNDGNYHTVTFTYTVGDNVVDNNGAGSGVSTAYLSTLEGKDIALRFKGYTNCVNIDNVSVSITVGDSGPGPVDHFVISPIVSPQAVGTPITGITITAQDASNNTAASFTGTVAFGGTGGFSGASANFTAGVLSGVSVTPTIAGSNLTFAVDNGSGQTGLAVIATIKTQYAAWSNGAAFNADANGDGIQNGMAWLLGAADPSESALDTLPAASRNGNNLRLTFRCLKSDKRGDTVLKVQFSNDLGQSDPWSIHEAEVPDLDDIVNDVGFDTTDDGDFINVIADVPAGGATLFGRIMATE